MLLHVHGVQKKGILLHYIFINCASIETILAGCCWRKCEKQAGQNYTRRCAYCNTLPYVTLTSLFTLTAVIAFNISTPLNCWYTIKMMVQRNCCKDSDAAAEVQWYRSIWVWVRERYRCFEVERGLTYYKNYTSLHWIHTFVLHMNLY